MGYQLQVTTGPDTAATRFAVKADTGDPHGWATLTTWTLTDPRTTPDDPTDADTLAAAEAGAHGWRTTGPGRREGATTSYPAVPVDWRTALCDATRRRADTQTEAAATDLAWRVLVADTPRNGEPGYVSTIDIAEMANVTRHRVYQLQGVGKKTGFRPPPG